MLLYIVFVDLYISEPNIVIITPLHLLTTVQYNSYNELINIRHTID